MPSASELQNLCPACGEPMPAEILLGHCPRCLLAEITGGGSDPEELPGSEDAAPFAEQVENIAGYELGSKLGEGGFAVVYRAEQQEPVRRSVALKILKSGSAGAQAGVRFEAERQALAILDHPAIAKIYDAGETDLGRPYFAMELVEGKTVTDHCQQHALAVRKRLDLFLRICDGVQHAHQRGIIHRDLKPSNLLVSQEGEPKIIDFGIARATEQNLSELTLVTNPAQMLGTPAYMTPEQAERRSEAIDTRTDVYALGAVLYELLAGVAPHADSNSDAPVPFDEILRRIREDDPPKPSSQAKGKLASDLDWIVLKALRKRPADRYASVAELAADLNRHLDNQPIEARPPSLGYVARKFVRRNRALAAGVMAGGLALLLGTITSTVLYLRAENNAARAKTNEGRAVESESREKSASSRSDFLAAGMLLRHQKPVDAVAHLIRAVRTDPANRAARFKLLYYLASENYIQPALPPLMHEGIITEVAISPDGHFAASVSHDNTARLWDLKTGALLHTWPHRAAPVFVEFSPDGARLVTAGYDGAAHLWDVSSGRRLHTLQHRGTVWTARFSPDGERLVTASQDRSAVIWDTADGEALHRLDLASAIHTAARFTPDGNRVITRAGKQAQVWDTRTGQPHGPAIAHRSSVVAMALSADGSLLATADNAGFAQVWDVDSGEPRSPPLAHGAGLETIDLSPDGSRVATGTRRPDQSVRLWKTRSGSLAAPPIPYGDTIKKVRFTPRGDRLIAVARTRDRFDPAIRIWDARTGEPRSSPVSLLRGAKAMALSRDGKRLVTGARDFAVRVWDIRSRAMAPLALKAGSDGVWNVTFTPDSRAVGALSRGGHAEVWDVTTGERRKGPPHELLTTVLAGWEGANLTGGVRPARLNLAVQQLEMAPNRGEARSITNFLPPPFATCRLHTIAASTDGSTLATGCVHGTIRLWDVGTRQQRREAVELDSPAERLAYLPAAKSFAVSTRGGRLLLVPLTPGEPSELFTSGDEKSWSTSLAVDSRGTELVAGFSDGTVRLWKITPAGTSEPLLLRGHEGEVRHLVFTPDGTRLVTGAADRAAIVWERSTGRLLHRIEGHIDEVPAWALSVAVTPDSRCLVTSGANDNTARSWDLATGASLAPPMQGESGSLTLLSAPRTGYFAYGMDANFEVILWDPKTGEALTPLLKQSQRSSALAFSPDERHLATACWDNIVRVWDMPPGEELLPEWFLQFAEAHIGLRLDSGGVPRNVALEELARRRAEVVARQDGENPLVRWAKWLATEPGPSKSISPWSTRTPDTDLMKSWAPLLELLLKEGAP